MSFALIFISLTKCKSSEQLDQHAIDYHYIHDKNDLLSKWFYYQCILIFTMNPRQDCLKLGTRPGMWNYGMESGIWNPEYKGLLISVHISFSFSFHSCSDREHNYKPTVSAND